MRLALTKITDRLNEEFVLRTPHISEAQNILDSMVQIAADSPYILSTPQSFQSLKLESQIDWLQKSEQSDCSIIIGVYNSNNEIIGLCNGRSYADVKRKHRAALGISLELKYRNRGLGKKIMEVLIQEMKKFSGLKIIELDVMIQNTSALKIYESLGFKSVGVFPDAFFLPSGEKADNMTMYLNVNS